MSTDFLIIENSPPNRYCIEVTNSEPMETVEKSQQNSIQIKMDIQIVHMLIVERIENMHIKPVSSISNTDSVCYVWRIDNDLYA